MYAGAYMSDSLHVCMCANSRYRCSIIQSISLGFKALTRFLSSPFNTPPPNCKILPEVPQGEAKGKRDLEERGESTTTTAASKSQQPGEGVWVIFYGWRGTTDVHLFISTVSIDVRLCVCVCVCVCVCADLSLLTFYLYRKKPKVTSHSSECRGP